jgi:hypothetical protein
LATSLSTSHDSSSSFKLSDSTVYVSSAPLAVVRFETFGGAMPAGSSARARSTALRTSPSASSLSFSSSKLTLMFTAPAVIVVLMWSRRVSEVRVSSILRATSVSSCDGAAPSSAAVMLTCGRSVSGRSWISRLRKPMTPRKLSKMNSRTAGTGLRIDHAETFIARAPASTWARCQRPR